MERAKLEIFAANGRESRSGGGPGDRSVATATVFVKERRGNSRVLIAVILLIATAAAMANATALAGHTGPCGLGGGLRVCGYAGAGTGAGAGVLAAAKAGLAR